MVLNNKIYVAGGMNSQGTSIKAFEVDKTRLRSHSPRFIILLLTLGKPFPTLALLAIIAMALQLMGKFMFLVEGTLVFVFIFLLLFKTTTSRLWLLWRFMTPPNKAGRLGLQYATLATLFNDLLNRCQQEEDQWLQLLLRIALWS